MFPARIAPMIEKDLISIGEAVSILGVSIDTLRRWDKSGKLRSIKTEGGHRKYYRSQLELFLNDLFKMAKSWVLEGNELSSEFYCSNSAVFQTRLARMQDILGGVRELALIYPLILAAAGEIGNNSFDHNLGNWPDIPGVFFGHDINKKIIVLADRGRGIFATLKRVKPELNTDAEALRVAFTEVISGRAPENRGNGLKFVRKVVSENPIGLLFQTGNAELILEKDNDKLDIKEMPRSFRGCLTLITF